MTDNLTLMKENGPRRNLPTVCHVLHTLNVGGAEVLTARLVRRMADRYRILLACLDELGSLGEDLRNDGFDVEVMNRRPGLDLKCASRLGKFFQMRGVDIIQAHQYTPFFYSLLARWRHRRAPILFLEHGRHQPDYPRRKRIFTNRMLLKKKDRVVGVGEAVRHALIDNEGIPAHRVGVVYNGIPLEKYSGGPHKRERARVGLGLSRHEFVVIQVARLDPIKDHATALRAFARVRETIGSGTFLIVGDGPERGAIEAAIGSLGLSERVRLLGTRSDVHELLAAADAFLLTSTSEGIPLTVIEAMAAGLPVVATRVGGVPEVVEDGRTGLLAPAGRDEELARHLVRLANEPTLRDAMGEHGRGRAEAKFSEDEMVRQYDRLYHEMLGPIAT